MTSDRSFCCVYCVTSVFVELILAASTFGYGPPATYSLDQIHKGATESRERIRNLRVEYKMTTKAIGTDQVMLDENNRAALGTVTKLFAYDGEKRYARQQSDTESGKTEVVTRIFDGKNAFFYRKGSLMVTDGKDRNIDQGEYYCVEMLQLPISDEMRANYDNGWHFPHCLRSGVRDDIVVLPEQESIDEVMCHVVRCSDILKLWVDPKNGFALRRMVSHKGSGGRNKEGESVDGGSKIADYTFAGFQEASEGVWLPTRCIRLTYPQSPPSDQPNLEMRIDVSSLKVNQTEESDFDLAVPSGTMVLGNRIGFTTKGDKTMLMDDIATGLSPQIRPLQSRFRLILIASLTVVVVVSVVIWITRKRSSN